MSGGASIDPHEARVDPRRLPTLQFSETGVGATATIAAVGDPPATGTPADTSATSATSTTSTTGGSGQASLEGIVAGAGGTAGLLVDGDGDGGGGGGGSRGIDVAAAPRGLFVMRGFCDAAEAGSIYAALDGAEAGNKSWTGLKHDNISVKAYTGTRDGMSMLQSRYQR